MSTGDFTGDGDRHGYQGHVGAGVNDGVDPQRHREMDLDLRGGAGAPAAEQIDLVQDQTAVTATINDTANALGFGSGTGTVSNPRSLAISMTFRAGTPLAFAVTFVGRIDDTLTDVDGNRDRLHGLSVHVYGDDDPRRRNKQSTRPLTHCPPRKASGLSNPNPNSLGFSPITAADTI